jgi:hypothetical protein
MRHLDLYAHHQELFKASIDVADARKVRSREGNSLLSGIVILDHRAGPRD